MTTITRPGPTNLQNEPGYELDLLWDQMADVVEATEVVANAALPAATAATTYAPIAKGVTNGDSHNHDGGDGGQIAYSVLSGLPTLGTAAALNVGTAASNVVQLNGSAQLPAVDGSLLTGLPTGGVTDHGALTGLSDDDHSQYHTDARGDARYAPLAHANNTSNPHSVTAAQAGADATGTAAAAVSAHAGGASVHAIASITGLETALSGKSPTSHDHAATYAPIANGVTNGDSHDHNGGDGAQIAYANLSGLPTLGTAAALNVGTAASNVVQLNGTAQLPAVDGSLLTNLPGGGVTDHGALTGLADDDHSQYPLGNGRTGGQTLKGGTAAGDSLTLQGTAGTGTATTTAVAINVGTNGSINAFSAINSGKVSIVGGGVTPSFLCDIGGYGARTSLGAGTQQSVLAIKGDTPGTAHIQMCNVDAGATSDIRFSQLNDQKTSYLSFATPSDASTGAFFDVTKGAGHFIFNNVISGSSRSLGIGVIGTGDLVLGVANRKNITVSGANRNITFEATDTTTNAVFDLLRLGKNCTAAGAAGLGVRVLMSAKSSTTDNTEQAAIESSWVSATHASRKGRLKISAYDTAIREGIRVEANGTVAMIGFFGVSAVARPTALTAALTSITHTAPGTPDYAMQALTAGGFGFATADEGHSLLAVIANLQARVNELETKLQALGLLT